MKALFNIIIMIIDKAVILAGGVGTRLRPITYEIPKPLIPVKKKPLVNHIIDFLDGGGIRDIALIISAEHRDDFKRWQKYYRKARIKIFVEKSPMGTFGALRIVKKWLGRKSFVVTNGDCLIDFDLDRLIKFHKKQGAVAATPCMFTATTGNYTVPKLNGNLIERLERKDVHAGTVRIAGGPYIFKHSIFDYDDPGRTFLNIEADIFPKLMSEKQLVGTEVDGRFYDCGLLENWERAIKEW